MPEEILPNVRRLVAPNPGPLTDAGTNTYVLGRRGAVIVDPGPDDPEHMARILDLTSQPAAILITHSHIDHTALVPRLAAQLGVPVFAFGDSTAGRSTLPDYGPAFQEGFGTDHNFRPDRTVADGEVLTWDDITLKAHWTPGHFPNHLCFEHNDWVLSGDVVMGWSTTIVSPPEGSIAQFMASCDRLAQLRALPFLPGHGDVVTDGPARARNLRAHRMARDAQVRDFLTNEPQTAMMLTKAIYTDTPVHLHPAAARNVLAHLLGLVQAGQASATTPISPDAFFVKNP